MDTEKDRLLSVKVKAGTPAADTVASVSGHGIIGSIPLEELLRRPRVQYSCVAPFLHLYGDILQRTKAVSPRKP